MRTRALAVGSDRSNAIGPLELECTPEGLVIVHLGVRSFQQGYAPGAATAGTRVVVPWASVRTAQLEADRLLLELDAAVTPHHRLLLSRFSEGDPPDPVELRRRRFLVRIGTAATLLVAATLTAITAARLSSASGAGSAILLGCLAAAVVLLVGVVADERLALLGRTSDAARMAFVSELSLRFPGLVTSAAPSRSKSGVALPEWSFQALLPRSTAAIVITMSAALLGAVLTASWISRTPVEHPSVEGATPALRARERAQEEQPAAPAPTPALVASPATPSAAIAGPTPAASAPAPTPVPSTGDTALLAGTCTCRRSDSLLWRDGLPKVSMVLIERRQTVHHGHDHLDLELGVVNNSDAPIPEVSLVVHFYEKDPAPSTKRVHTFDRPVYFEGPFAAGQAIKWHVEARGNDFEVEGLPAGTLDPSGSDTAPTTLLAELLRANHRPVRLHGAMMLAYVGDPRAREGALGLREALREDEAPYLDRLTWALHPVRTCDVQVQETGSSSRTVRACIWNGTPEPQKGLSLRVRALDRPFRHTTPVEAPPLVIAEKTWTLSGELAPSQGGIATVLFDPSNADGVTPAAFEAHAE